MQANKHYANYFMRRKLEKCNADIKYFIDKIQAVLNLATTPTASPRTEARRTGLAGRPVYNRNKCAPGTEGMERNANGNEKARRLATDSSSSYKQRSRSQRLAGSDLMEVQRTSF